jgi:hypothetical protein
LDFIPDEYVDLQEIICIKNKKVKIFIVARVILFEVIRCLAGMGAICDKVQTEVKNTTEFLATIDAYKTFGQHIARRSSRPMALM